MRIPYRKPLSFKQTKQDPFLTEGKFIELKNRLDRLKNISRPQAAAEVARLAEMGDFSENTAYQMAKGRLRGINSAIINIENQVNHAVIISPQEKSDVIQIGHTVTVDCANNQRTYQILGSTETNPSRGIISHNSPIGAALIGRRVGDKIKIKLANKEVEYRIVKIEWYSR